jgi:hypothetical protein
MTVGLMDASSRHRSVALAVSAGVAISLMGVQPARADEPIITGATAEAAPERGIRNGAPTLGTHDYLITFERPVSSFWDDATSETWTLKDPTGKVICELPCRSPLHYPWGAYVEGSANGPNVERGSTVHLALPDDLETRFLLTEVPFGATLSARPKPEKGCPDCVIGLGIASGASFAGGIGFLVWFAENLRAHNNIGVAVFGLGGAAFMGVMSLTLGTIALVWGGWSEGPKLDLFHAPPSSNPSPMRVSFSSSGVAVSF